jgi:ATP-dependent DNA helicase RecG
MNLQTPISHGSRIYKAYASRLEKLGIVTIQDFLFHLPSRYEDFSIVSKIEQIQLGETVTIQGQVLEMKNNYLRGGRIKTMQRATVTDGTGSIELTWFNQPFLLRAIPENATISASGKVELYGRKLKMSSPHYEILQTDASQPLHTARLIPVYPETKGVSSKWLRRQINTLLEENLEEIEEYLPDEIIKVQHFMGLREALQEVHFPRTIENAERAKERLAFDELLLMQLAAQKRRAAWKEQKLGNAFTVDKHSDAVNTLISALPFKLTTAQERAVTDILKDLAKEKPMNRLLQGDVGSGKTIVAAIALYEAHLNGYQSVLMAPTEILATQHYLSISKLLEPFGVKVELVTGSKKILQTSKPVSRLSRDQSKKNALLPGSPIESGMTNDTEFHILIGTHAVLSEKVKFDNLGLIIIDEQQRFGVEQRGIIRQKGDNPHLLTMTATPIPRTVALTMYGDLDLSYLNEMPHGRKKVKTWLVPPEKRDGAYDWIRKQITETDSQIFIICPFIEVSESMMTIKAASKEYERLRTEVFPDLKLGLLHGKLKGKEKDEVLKQFKDRAFDILVATPVVEVGIDVPNATVIMIEASERFGLAQLHQLRGRVGRGDKQSYCLLFTDSLQAQTSQRLKGMETLYSGAELAELDLKLRGPGNLYGTAQHGIPTLKVATFSDTDMIQKAKHTADAIFPKLADFKDLEEKVTQVTLQKVSPD